MSEIVNRVAKSGIITIELESFLPDSDRLAVIDIKDQLWQGMALKEKEFRDYIAQTDWSEYKDKYVAVHCSADAIIPNWAYMLLASSLADYARKVFFGNLAALETHLIEKALEDIDAGTYKDARVVIKGCGNKEIDPSVYIQITTKLKPYVKSLMFGEPCSTVPVFKRKKLS